MIDLEDPFLQTRLNPLFLQTLKGFFSAIAASRNTDPALKEKAERNLALFIFRRLLQPFYLTHLPEKKAKIFFLTVVHTDGMGDYFAMLKCAKAVKEKLPLLDIQVAYTHLLDVPKICPSEFLLTCDSIHDFYETSDRPILEPVLGGLKKLPFEERVDALKKELEETESIYKETTLQALEDLMSDYRKEIAHLESFNQEKNRALALYKEMQKSQLLVHISLAINTFDNPLLASKSLYFAEAGNFSGIANALERNMFSMGLHPFEEGLLLKKTYNEPSPEKQKGLYVGYLTRTPQQRALFIYLVCLLEEAHVCSVEIWLPELSEEELNREWLSQRGFAKGVWIKKGGSSITLFEKGEGSGKILRLVEALPLPSKEFERAVAMSEDLLGCTGDGSLADALVAGKIPFYELRPHKQQTWDELQKLAKALKLKAVCSYLKLVAEYDKAPIEKRAVSLSLALQAPLFKKEWQTLLAFIHRYYNLESSLLAHIQRYLLHIERPSLKDFEKDLFEQFLSGKLPFHQKGMSPISF